MILLALSRINTLTKLHKALCHFVFALDNPATLLLSCQPRVTVTSYFVYKAIRDLESIDHLFINYIHRIGLIHKRNFDLRKLK